MGNRIGDASPGDLVREDDLARELEKVLFDAVACGRTADYVGGLGVRAGR